MNIVFEYFPDLSSDQKSKILQLKDIYGYWNDKINVISRKDFNNFYEHHVLHSLAIAKFICFTKGSFILDAGTGGGFPGIPLAIVNQEAKFHLVDSIGKKIKVLDDVCLQLKLNNVESAQARAESLTVGFDFVVSRAVTTIPKMVNWIKKLVKKHQQNDLRNGLLYLKGGDFLEELENLRFKTHVHHLNETFNLPFFETKKLVHVEL